MKFEQVYNLMVDYQARTNGWYVVLHESTLRVRLLSPDKDFVQLYWLGADGLYFDEALSARCIVRALREPQDLTFPIPGSPRERTLKAPRLDPGTAACQLLLVSVTLGGR